MVFSYGSYSHDDNEVELAAAFSTGVFSDGLLNDIEVRWQLRGKLQAASQSALTAALRALEAAYSVQGAVARLYDNSSALTVHVLGDGALGGCRVESFGYTPGGGAEYSTWRSYEITLAATYKSRSTALSSFHEAVSVAGGGPEYRHFPMLRGPSQKQMLLEQAPYTATQSGEAVGRFSWPQPPAPIWPFALIRAPRVERMSPRRMGPAGSPSFTDFPLSYSYEFESASPLFGMPNRWLE